MVYDIITAVASAAALFVFLSKKKKKPVKTAQDLVNYKDITEDGIVELDDGRYRLVLEVEPTNLGLRSRTEQKAVWLGFRSLVNSLSLPVTFLVQSRYYDMTDYLKDLENGFQKMPRELSEYGRDVLRFYREQADARQVRDKKHYIIIKMEAGDLSNADSGINTDIEAVNAVFSVIKPGKKLSDEEMRDLARQELENTASLIGNYLSGMDMHYRRLNKYEVLDMIYSTLNRDLSPVQRLTDAVELGGFSPFQETITPHIGSQ